MKSTNLKIVLPLCLSFTCLAAVLLSSAIHAPAAPMIVTAAKAPEQAPLEKVLSTDPLHPSFDKAHTEWVAKSLKAIQTIKPGMTRKELGKVFTTEGGLSTRTSHTYVYQECPYIKVTIEFEPVGAGAPGGLESPNDRVLRVSQPFLQWTIAD